MNKPFKILANITEIAMLPIIVIGCFPVGHIVYPELLTIAKQFLLKIKYMTDLQKHRAIEKEIEQIDFEILYKQRQKALLLEAKSKLQEKVLLIDEDIISKATDNKN